jgi:hypothetical protein
MYLFLYIHQFRHSIYWVLKEDCVKDTIHLKYSDYSFFGHWKNPSEHNNKSKLYIIFMQHQFLTINLHKFLTMTHMKLMLKVQRCSHISLVHHLSQNITRNPYIYENSTCQPSKLWDTALLLHNSGDPYCNIHPSNTFFTILCKIFILMAVSCRQKPTAGWLLAQWTSYFTIRN